MMQLHYDPALACDTLTAADPVLGKLIARVGPFAISQRMNGDTYASLLRAIVNQQLSVKAAATIHGRVLALFDGGEPTPQALLDVEYDKLRAAGLSGRKVEYAKDLAAKTLDGTVPDREQLQAMDDDDIIKQLTGVRGIGRWTVEMLLIFSLGRPDVLPVDDLGVRKGFARTWGEQQLRKPKALADYGRRWAPYRSVAAWYLWRATEITSG